MTRSEVLTAAQMQAAEQALFDSGTSVTELMESAGTGAAEWVRRIAAGRSVSVLCGPGNNGGDGYVIARRLLEAGLSVRVVAPIEPRTEAAKAARARYTGNIVDADDAKGHIFVDCGFGTGLSRPLGEPFASALRKLYNSHPYRIAIDLPSGVESDDGTTHQPDHFTFDLTLALGAWKRSHWLMPAMAQMGAKRLVDIGVKASSHARLIERPQLGAPGMDDHKYRRGLVAIVGGEMPGAAMHACQAALRAGAGYVKLISDHPYPVAPADLVVDNRPVEEAMADERINAFLIGPGLGRTTEAIAKLEKVLAANRPVVLDADALHLLRPNMLSRQENIIVTPHEGELAKLCENFGIREESKVARAEALASKSGMTVLAKGPDTIAADPQGLSFFPSGPSWLSVAGSGDVLAGIIVSRLASWNMPSAAVEEAVWLHHEAARICGPAFTASELARSISHAYAALL